MWIAQKDSAITIPPVQGQIAAINCANTVQVVDLTSLPGNQTKPGDPQSQNPIGHYVRIVATGGDVYYAFGNNINALKNCSPNSCSAVNATTGKVTLTNNEMDCIPNGQSSNQVLVAGNTPTVDSPPGSSSPARYVALVSLSGNPIARIRQSGP